MKDGFKLITSYCKYCAMGNEGGRFIDTCREKSNIPHGHSWGECNEKVCPLMKKLNQSKL